MNKTIKRSYFKSPDILWDNAKIFTEEPQKLGAVLAALEQYAPQSHMPMHYPTVLSEISEIIQSYVLGVREDSQSITGAARRDRLKSLMNNLGKVRAEYEAIRDLPHYLNPIIDALEEEPGPLQGCAEALRKVDEFLIHTKEQEKIIGQSYELSKLAVGGKGRPPDSAFERGLICKLADTYETFACEERVGHSSPFDFETASKAEKITGPFVRFVLAVVAASPILADINKDWGYLIDEALQVRNGSPDTAFEKMRRSSRREKLMQRAFALGGREITQIV